jgi:hypothetical protein
LLGYLPKESFAQQGDKNPVPYAVFKHYRIEPEIKSETIYNTTLGKVLRVSKDEAALSASCMFYLNKSPDILDSSNWSEQPPGTMTGPGP